MTRLWSYGGEARLSFRTEITRSRPADLAEKVRSLEARLRATPPGQLTAEEAHALHSLLQTVDQLTEPSLSGRG
ncbi:MAG TPA: hypothetical protein VGL99_25360 [Chloroflexota bacterium]|jgi:hypothetical protein